MSMTSEKHGIVGVKQKTSISTLKTNFSKELKETSWKTFQKEFQISNKQWIMSASLILVWIVQND